MHQEFLWMSRPKSRSFMSQAIGHCPLLRKLYKALVWCKTLREEIEHGVIKFGDFVSKKRAFWQISDAALIFKIRPWWGYLLFFANQLYTIFEFSQKMLFTSLTMLLFIKLFLYKERVVSLFTANIVSMHFLSTWQFWPFQRSWTHISSGVGEMAYGLSCSGGLAQVENKAQRWGFKSARTPCFKKKKKKKIKKNAHNSEQLLKSH